jgi:hypothetical protein
MRQVIRIFLLVQLVTQGFGQSAKNYRLRSTEIQHEIWEDTSAAFKVTQIPAEMNRESGVILATSFEVNDNSNFTFKIDGPAAKLTLRITDHNRVKLIDRRAVADYSIIGYSKNFHDSHVHMYDVYRNISETYIGVKIIRTDGSETIVNTDDDVLKKNGKNEDELHIPGLKEGDIIDYYVRTEKILDANIPLVTERPYTLIFGNNYYPTLYEKLRLRFGERFRANYISANGAPSLVKIRDADANTTLEIEQTNLPRIHDTLWTSELRQLPFITFELVYSKKAEANPAQFVGDVKPGTMYSKYIEETSTYLSPRMQFDNQPLKIAKAYFGNKVKMDQLPHDTIVKALYNSWYYLIFNSRLTDTGNYANKVKYARALRLEIALQMSKMLASLGINSTVYLVCSRNSASFKNIFDISEIDALLFVPVDDTHKYWMAFDDILTLLNEIPARFQGEFAFGIQNGPKIDPAGKQPDNYKIPITTAIQNTITDSIQVQFDPSNALVLRIGQSSRITGSPRHQIQRDLMLFDDIDSALSSPLSQKTILSKLGEKRADKESAEEREDQKKNFTESIHSRFGSFPREVLHYEVINPSLCRIENSFSYRVDFTMDKWVSVDNSQYKVRAGKLIGDYRDVTQTDHIRSMNVYLPDARTFDVQISIIIPEGYQVKNIDDLNISISNETGSCESNASITGQILKWHVSETFLNNFEPASNWPKLAGILHTIYTLSQKEITMIKS